MKTDFLVIGTGLAGLAYALKMAEFGSVTILSKTKSNQTNTNSAQGGIAAVYDQEDNFEKHISDTVEAGGGLCREEIVQDVVRQAPERIQDLISWGVKFDLKEDNSVSLTQEGGHSLRRILHVKDYTGAAIQQTLLDAVNRNPNIQILEDHFAIDLLIDKKTDPKIIDSPTCIGAYVFDNKNKKVITLLAKATCLASGGAGKTYLYTSNWDGATGDGIAMAYRAGCRVANLEMMQFHPTCLYHTQARNFLISEAVRGEGGVLVHSNGEEFMGKYHKLGSLAPRDIVAFAIDTEIKHSAKDCVYLNITHKPKEYLQERFPVIYAKLLEFGIKMEKDLIPVVPAAHYHCGGVHIDKFGRTDLKALFAIGETAYSGLHGANRLASNSLLECLAFAHNASEYFANNKSEFKMTNLNPSEWKESHQEDKDEMVMITHMWDEIRRLMWNYVGIVRSNRRLERAEHRLTNLNSEIKQYYWNFKMHTDILELRNLALVASLTVRSALKRKESRGVHFNLDYPEKAPVAKDTII